MKKLQRALAAAVLLVVTLEGLARLDDLVTWGAPFFGPYSYEVLNLVDEHGVRGRPGARYEKWQQNVFGFRGPEITLEKPAGVTRVVLVGASEVFGLYETPGHELSAELQRRLEAARPGRFQVINAGRAGMTPPRVPHFFRSWLRQFRPDVVIYYPTPHFYLDEVPPTSTLPTGRTAPPNRPRLLEKTKTLLRQSMPLALRTRLNRILIHRERARQPHDWVWPEVPAEHVAVYRAHLTAIVQAVRETGVRLHLGLHAIRFGEQLTPVDEQQLLALGVFYPRASRRVLLGIDAAINAVTREAAAPPAVTLIDLDRRLGKDPRFFADFSHFTDQGSAAAAATIAEALLAPGEPGTR